MTANVLASSPKVEGVTGTYFANGAPRTSNKASYDENAAARLWQVNAGLVGLNSHSIGRCWDLTAPAEGWPLARWPTSRER